LFVLKNENDREGERKFGLKMSLEIALRNLVTWGPI